MSEQKMAFESITENYIPAIGAAFLVAFADRLRNGDNSAITKFGTQVDLLTFGSYGSTAGMILVILFAALLVYVYRPKERKEAFALGLSVLATFNLISSPQQPVGKPEDASNHSVSMSTGGDHTLNFISSAYAGEAETSAPATSRVWVFLEGPSQLNYAATHIFIYSESGSVIANTVANTSFTVPLPMGRYKFQISHPGYKTIVFTVSVAEQPQAFKIRMPEGSFLNFSNFFGPTEIEVDSKQRLSTALHQAQDSCKESKAVDMTNSLKKFIDKDLLNNLSNSARRLICLPKN